MGYTPPTGPGLPGTRIWRHGEACSFARTLSVLDGFHPGGRPGASGVAAQRLAADDRGTACTSTGGCEAAAAGQSPRQTAVPAAGAADSAAASRARISRLPALTTQRAHVERGLAFLLGAVLLAIPNLAQAQSTVDVAGFRTFATWPDDAEVLDKGSSVVSVGISNWRWAFGRGVAVPTL